MTDQRDAPRTADSLEWQYVFWPQPFREAAALALLRHWAAQTHAPQVILEARADDKGVDYLMGCQLRHAPAARHEVEQLVTGSVVTRFEAADREDINTARRLHLTSGARPLEPSDAVASSRSILHALTTVQRGERLVIQIILGPRQHPRLGPDRPRRDGQSTVSKVLDGVLPERRPDIRQAVRKKLGQHGFSATLRIGVHAPTPERRRVLLLGLAAAFATVEAPGVHFKLKPEKAGRINAPRSTWSLFTPSQHLTVPEVAWLSGWPISDRDEPFPGQPPRHPRPLRPSTAVQTGERRVATASAPGINGPIGYNVTDALRNTWVLGPTGVGKSTLELNLIVQDLEAGRPVVVVEPKDLVRDVLVRVPAHRKQDIVVLDPLDEAPVGINPLDTSHRHGRPPELIADTLLSTFKAIYGDSLGPRSADILRNCLQVLALGPGRVAGHAAPAAHQSSLPPLVYAPCHARRPFPGRTLLAVVRKPVA